MQEIYFDILHDEFDVDRDLAQCMSEFIAPDVYVFQKIKVKEFRDLLIKQRPILDQNFILFSTFGKTRKRLNSNSSSYTFHKKEEQEAPDEAWECEERFCENFSHVFSQSFIQAVKAADVNELKNNPPPLLNNVQLFS